MEDIEFWSKSLKISMLVKLRENIIMVKISGKSHFWWKFSNISIFGENLQKILILVKF